MSGADPWVKARRRYRRTSRVYAKRQVVIAQLTEIRNLLKEINQLKKEKTN